MKKLLPVLGITMLMLLAACQQSPTPEKPLQAPQKPNVSLFTRELPKIGYATQMQKPDFEAMDNKDAVQQKKFNTPWTKDYTVTQEDLDAVQSCEKEIALSPYDSYENTIKVKKADFKLGKSFSIKGNYHGSNPYPLPAEIIAQIKKHGFGILPFPEIFEGELKKEEQNPDYQHAYGEFLEEERVRKARKIGGSNIDFDGKYLERYPFNTLFVTNDLLLHVFHKLFSNELQYFEESEARPILADLSAKMFSTFQLGSSKRDQFLTAYWLIPHALLPSNEELIKELQTRENAMRENYNGESDPQAEFSDEELKSYLSKRFTKLLKKVSPEYQEALTATWEAVRAADQPKSLDLLFKTYRPDSEAVNFFEQDYTQFRPRSHYTNSSFLKTYFMAMKWLMREKFYFADQELAETALYLVHSLPEQELKKLNHLQEAILALVGSDDDAGIQVLKDFISKHDLKQKSMQLTASQLKELQSLVQQKIMSTSYTTPTIGEKDEQLAKAEANGFVFFGEKFTIDSYLFDLLTAGSAEEQTFIKPNVQTALLVPDILENHTPAHELVKLWLQEQASKGRVKEGKDDLGTYTQISSYPANKAEAQTQAKKELEQPLLLKTLYHKRLAMLGQLFVPIKNAPYFKTSPLYVFKNLNSYLGSYTELKHDTLLYVKQSYAEMGAGGI